MRALGSQAAATKCIIRYQSSQSSQCFFSLSQRWIRLLQDTLGVPSPRISRSGYIEGRGLPISLPPTGVPPGSTTLLGVTGPVTLEASYPALNPALIPGLRLPSLTDGAPSFPTPLAAIPITTGPTGM